jgi:hypothetical protein
MFHDVRQWTDEWFNLRLGKCTSSNFACIMANNGKAFWDPAKRYAQKLALERVTGRREEESYSNALMERGNELEPLARVLYSQETMSDVENGWFFSEWDIGDSPDWLVGEDGCIEIKSVIPATHWERIEKGSFDSAYKWQIHGHMMLSGRKWCDFVSFCPEFPENKQLHIFRVERDEEVLAEMRKRIDEFLVIVKHYENLLI